MTGNVAGELSRACRRRVPKVLRQNSRTDGELLPGAVDQFDAVAVRKVYKRELTAYSQPVQ